MILTGRMIDAEEAERMGLVARVIPADKLVEEGVTHGPIYRFVLPAGRVSRQGMREPCL